MNIISVCNIIRRASPVIIYFTGVYASYVDINKFSSNGCKNILHSNATVTKPKTLGSHIVLYTHFSYQHAKNYYSTHINPVVYSAAWPIIQFTIGASSVFIGALGGFIEWNKNGSSNRV